MVLAYLLTISLLAWGGLSSNPDLVKSVEGFYSMLKYTNDSALKFSEEYNQFYNKGAELLPSGEFVTTPIECDLGDEVFELYQDERYIGLFMPFQRGVHKKWSKLQEREVSSALEKLAAEADLKLEVSYHMGFENLEFFSLKNQPLLVLSQNLDGSKRLEIRKLVDVYCTSAPDCPVRVKNELARASINKICSNIEFERNSINYYIVKSQVIEDFIRQSLL